MCEEFKSIFISHCLKYSLEIKNFKIKFLVTSENIYEYGETFSGGK